MHLAADADRRAARAPADPVCSPSSTRPSVARRHAGETTTPAFAVEGCVHAERAADHRCTELGTTLGMLGFGGHRRGRSLTNGGDAERVAPRCGTVSAQLRTGGAYDAEFHGAWENGQSFLTAPRRTFAVGYPDVVEWKGTGRAPGDEVAPIDLPRRPRGTWSAASTSPTSCSTSRRPTSSTSRCSLGRAARAARGSGRHREASDWYTEVAPTEYQALYDAVRDALPTGDGIGARPRARRPGHSLTRLPPPRGHDRSVPLPGLDEVGRGHRQGRTEPESHGTSPPTAAQNAAGPRSSTCRRNNATRSARWLRPGWPPVRPRRCLREHCLQPCPQPYRSGEVERP